MARRPGADRRRPWQRWGSPPAHLRRKGRVPPALIRGPTASHR